MFIRCTWHLFPGWMLHPDVALVRSEPIPAHPATNICHETVGSLQAAVTKFLSDSKLFFQTKQCLIVRPDYPSAGD